MQDFAQHLSCGKPTEVSIIEIIHLQDREITFPQYARLWSLGELEPAKPDPTPGSNPFNFMVLDSSHVLDPYVPHR